MPIWPLRRGRAPGPARRIAVLHAGGPKAGSAALRAALGTAAFARAGLLVPGAGTGLPAGADHDDLVRDLLGTPRAGAPGGIAGGLAAALAGQSHAVLVLASPQLARPVVAGGMAPVAGFLAELGYDVHVVLHLVDQPEAIEAGYAEAAAHLREPAGFNAHVAARLGRGSRAAAALLDLGRLSEVEPDGFALHPRPWSGPADGIAADFLEALRAIAAAEGVAGGLATPAPEALAAGPAGAEAPGAVLVEAARRLAPELSGLRPPHRALQAGEAARAELAAHLGPAAGLPRWQALTPARYAPLRARFAAGNDAFARRFWGRPWAEVFPARGAGDLVSTDLLDTGDAAGLARAAEAAEALRPRVQALARRGAMLPRSAPAAPALSAGGPKRLAILHAGMPKTGSSALQSFLARNDAALLGHGILYAGTGRSRGGRIEHGDLMRAITGRVIYDRTQGLPEALDAELARVPHEVLILSSEYLFGPLYFSPLPQVPEFLASRGYRIHGVMYLRDQPEFLNSTYSQMAKTAREARGFGAFLDERLSKAEDGTGEGRSLRLSRLLDPALASWGTHDFRPYDAGLRARGIEPDFLGAVEAAAHAQGLARGFTAEAAAARFERGARVNETCGPVQVDVGRRIARALAGRFARKAYFPVTIGVEKLLAAAVARAGLDEPAYAGMAAEDYGRIRAELGPENEAFARATWGRGWAEVFPPRPAGSFAPNDLDLVPRGPSHAAADALLARIMPEIEADVAARAARLPAAAAPRAAAGTPPG